MTLEISPYAAAQFRLGDWSVAPDRNEIRRDGEAVRLEPLSMRLLCLLADNAGRTVSRAEIVSRLWGGRAVTDDAIGRQIAKLREAFGDDAKRPAVIQTVPKVGVLLLLPVERIARPAPEPETAGKTATVVEPVRAPGRGRRWLFLGAALAGVGGVVAVLLLLQQQQQQQQATPDAGDATEIPVTAAVGLEQEPALSPNGAMLAYVASDGQQRFGLFVRRLAEDDATRLTTPGLGARRPAWSPEGDRIAFVQATEGGPACEIVVISPVSFLTRVVAPCRRARQAGLAWAGDTGLVVADYDERQPGRFRLYRVPLDGGVVTPLTDPPAGSSGDSHPTYAPEANAVFFLRGVSGDVTEVFRLDLATGAVTQVTREQSAIVGLATGGAGRLIIAAYNRADLPASIWSLNLRDGRWTRRATGGRYWNVTASADGRVVVFERPTYEFALRSHDLRTGQSAELTRTTQSEWYPALSPNGARLALISSRSGAQQVWLAGRDGSDLRQLTSLDRGYPEELAWAPDGRSLVMSWAVRGQYDLVQVDADSGAPRPLSQSLAQDEQHPVFGPDGALYFTRREGVDHRLVRRDLATGEERVVAGDVIKALPAGGGAFYANRPNREGIWRFTPGGPMQRVAPYPAAMEPRNWTYRDGFLWTLNWEGNLVRTNPGTGLTETVGKLEKPFAASGLEIRDGKAIYARQDDVDVDLYRLGP